MAIVAAAENDEIFAALNRTPLHRLLLGTTRRKRCQDGDQQKKTTMRKHQNFLSNQNLIVVSRREKAKSTCRADFWGSTGTNLFIAGSIGGGN
jgi:hypothetical protein